MKINIEKLKELIRKLSQAKILVIGDLALDEMVYGDTERISREAPVLILQHTHRKSERQNPYQYNLCYILR